MAERPAPIFGRRYRLRRRIARGGMAEVYLAHDQLLDRPVALKVLFPELSVDRNFVERFRREAQAAAGLNHPNIVSIYDWGEEDGSYYIVMELVDGRPLSTLLKAEHTLLADRAADIGAAVAAALAFAHKNGVVHRDVKPGNVLIDSAGNIKVADFGIARAANSTDNLTQTGAVMGTATYFSPEQAQGWGVDARSDIYSLGVVLYEMVCGQAPFVADNPVAVATKHVNQEPPPPRQLNSNLPAAFEAIILSCLAKDPDDRYASAEDLRADLLRFRQGRPVAAVAAQDANATQAMTSTRAMRADESTTVMPSAGRVHTAGGPPDRRTGAYVVLLFALLAVLFGLLFLLAREVGILGTSSPSRIDVPSVLGKPVEEAKTQLEDVGLKWRVEEQTNEAEPGTVVAQDPTGGTRVAKETEVVLTVAKGPDQVNVPNVVGRAKDAAQTILENANFTVRVVEENDDSAAPGIVLRQNPVGGSPAADGSDVTITVSSGAKSFTVPDVRGKTVDDASDTLRNSDGEFKVKTVTQASDDVDSGRVIRTDPANGESAPKGATVTIFVSSGPEDVTVPDVVGKTEADAKAVLTGAGFTVNVVNQPVLDPDQDGRVIDQSPNSGASRPKGSTVTITVGQM